MIMGPFTLHPGVIWSNEQTDPRVAQQIENTILSNVIVHSMPLPNRQIVLEAKSGNRSRGCFMRDQVDYLLTAEQNGTTFEIVYRGVTRNVVVKAGGVALVSKRETEAVEDTDYYTGTVTLQEV